MVKFCGKLTLNTPLFQKQFSNSWIFKEIKAQVDCDKSHRDFNVPFLIGQKCNIVFEPGCHHEAQDDRGGHGCIPSAEYAPPTRRTSTAVLGTSRRLRRSSFKYNTLRFCILRLLELKLIIGKKEDICWVLLEFSRFGRGVFLPT